MVVEGENKARSESESESSVLLSPMANGFHSSFSEIVGMQQRLRNGFGVTASAGMCAVEVAATAGIVVGGGGARVTK